MKSDAYKGHLAMLGANLNFIAIIINVLNE